MPSKNLLTPVNRRRYSGGVAETEVTRASRLDQIQADNRQPAVFFCPYAFARLLQWRALAEGTPSGVPASCIAGPRTPKPCACHPCFAASLAGFDTADTGGRTMLRHIPARFEQSSFPQFLSDKVSIAIRSAALAPDLASALDIAGAALVDIATIARGEVQTSTVVDDAACGTAVSPDTDDRFGFVHAAVD